MPKKEVAIKHAVELAVYLLIVWGFYRFLFKLPEEIEEIIIKPILWLLPVFYLLKKEKSKISTVGITTKNIFPAIYFSLGLGVIFAIEGIFANFIKYKEFDFGANLGEKVFLLSLVLSFATAISEEIAFRGFIFGRIWHATKNELFSNLVTSIVWALIHLPITVFWLNTGFSDSLSFLFLTTIFGIGSCFVYARTKNIFSSVLLHVLWEWPIILFR